MNNIIFLERILGNTLSLIFQWCKNCKMRNSEEENNLPAIRSYDFSTPIHYPSRTQASSPIYYDNSTRSSILNKMSNFESDFIIPIDERKAQRIRRNNKIRERKLNEQKQFDELYEYLNK